jgi:hypothetical protein
MRSGALPLLSFSTSPAPAPAYLGLPPAPTAGVGPDPDASPRRSDLIRVARAAHDPRVGSGGGEGSRAVEARPDPCATRLP